MLYRSLYTMDIALKIYAFSRTFTQPSTSDGRLIPTGEFQDISDYGLAGDRNAVPLYRIPALLSTLASSFLTKAGMTQVGALLLARGLISTLVVFATSPYTEDTNNRTYNTNDTILTQEEGNGAHASMTSVPRPNIFCLGNNPFIELFQIGDDITDGLVGYVSE